MKCKGVKNVENGSAARKSSDRTDKLTKKNKKSIILRLRERMGAGKTLLKMKIKSKSQMNGSYLFEAVAGFLSINHLALSSSSLNP